MRIVECCVLCLHITQCNTVAMTAHYSLLLSRICLRWTRKLLNSVFQLFIRHSAAASVTVVQKWKIALCFSFNLNCIFFRNAEFYEEKEDEICATISYSEKFEWDPFSLYLFHTPVTSDAIIADSHTKWLMKNKTKKMPPPSSSLSPLPPDFVRISCTFCISFISHSIHNVYHAEAFICHHDMCG